MHVYVSVENWMVNVCVSFETLGTGIVVELSHLHEPRRKGLVDISLLTGIILGGMDT